MSSRMEATILRWTPRIALVTSVIVIGLCAVSIYILTHYEAEYCLLQRPDLQGMSADQGRLRQGAVGPLSLRHHQAGRPRLSRRREEDQWFPSAASPVTLR